MKAADRDRLEGVLTIDDDGRAWGCMTRPWTHWTPTAAGALCGFAAPPG